MKSLAIVVPCYNGETRLPSVIENLGTLKSLATTNDAISFYFSDNHSSDRSVLLAQDACLFDSILTSSENVGFDRHLMRIADQLQQSHIFFLGVNYLIDSSGFISLWKLIQKAEDRADIVCIASEGRDVYQSSLLCANSASQFMRHAGPLLGGISCNIFMRSHFMSQGLKRFLIGTQWANNESGWAHTIVSLKILACHDFQAFYVLSPIVFQNPLGVSLAKAWHKPPELPIYLRINLYKITQSFAHYSHHKFIGIAVPPLFYDWSIVAYSRSIGFRAVCRCVSYSFRMCNIYYAMITSSSILIGYFDNLFRRGRTAIVANRVAMALKRLFSRMRRSLES